jgi:four helix bundle protein
MSYNKLQIWSLARQVVIDIHKMTLTLPKYEMYETGSQIRRSSKSVKSNIVEGYGRRYYKNDFIKYVVYALASNMETIDHLETLFETGSMEDKELYVDLLNKLELLGKKLNTFCQSLLENHQSPR